VTVNNSNKFIVPEQFGAELFTADVLLLMEKSGDSIFTNYSIMDDNGTYYVCRYFLNSYQLDRLYKKYHDVGIFVMLTEEIKNLLEIKFVRAIPFKQGVA
jgi:hypothetical protein